MDESVNLEMILELALVGGGALALIFVIALLTPWLAKHVDKWIAHYRSTHDSKKDVGYSVRSIYELPPKREPSAPETEEVPEKPTESESESQ